MHKAFVEIDQILLGKGGLGGGMNPFQPHSGAAAKYAKQQPLLYLRSA
jgi:hypothetical protein